MYVIDTRGALQRLLNKPFTTRGVAIVPPGHPSIPEHELNASFAERGLAIADRAMFQAILIGSVRQNGREFVPCDGQGKVVTRMTEADPSVVEGFDWLHARGMAKLVPEKPGVSLQCIEIVHELAYAPGHAPAVEPDMSVLESLDLGDHLEAIG